MAITAATLTSDFSGFLNRNQAAPIFEEARRRSVVQQLAQQVRLGPNGEAIPIVTGKPSAAWVAEGAQKAASEGSRSLVNMDPKKIATIVVVSAEVVRANPAGYMDDIRADVAEAFATAFDAAVLWGTSTPFASFVNQTTKSVEIGTTTQANGGIHGDVVAGLSALVADSRKLTGFAWGLQAEPLFLGAVDTTGRPLYIDSPPEETMVDGQMRGRMIGRPAVLDESLDNGTNRGFGGDFSKIAWGAVGGINYDISTEATVTINAALVSLWENNLVAVRAEAEYGCVISDVEDFVKFTDAV